MINIPDFDDVYLANPDPFDIDGSWYEQRKIAVTLAALGRPSYDHGWVPACGTGHLAAALAVRCHLLVVDDSSPTACALARKRLRGISSIDIRVHTLPDLPPGSDGNPFDLVVLSEVLYYLPPAALDRMPQMLTIATAGRSAEIVTTHWRHHPDDAYRSGAAATAYLDRHLQHLGWEALVRHDDHDFLVVSWQRSTGGDA